MSAELLALQIGSKFCPAEEILDGGAQGLTECSCFAYLVRTPRRLILIDTGYSSQELAFQAGFHDYLPVEKLLAEIAISPEQITDVVLTHGHEAHVGGIARFLQARIYIAARELRAMGELLRDPVNKKRLYRSEEIEILRAAPRLQLVKNCLAIDEHLRVDVVGGHTRGFLLPTYMTEGVSRVMLASDNVPLYRHLQGEAFSLNWCEGNRDIRERLKMRMFTAFVLPGCDPEVMQRYPLAAPRICRIL
ncbi:MAG: MBL fold metallo-hydrolase [bacterium]|nr:MBL fold metallo-hydrolase [bacterium]